MKEVHFFYVPLASEVRELPDDEAQHALRVLRMKAGDELMIMDGNGCFYKAEVDAASSGKRCLYKIIETMPQERPWRGRYHLAIAPTKMMERMEWLAEKATEIGFDELSLLDCRFSERRMVKTSRIEKIVVSAMKQSRKAWKPIVNEMTPFDRFLALHTSGHRFIAHCYDEIERVSLFDELRRLQCEPSSESETIVMVGPEGDFSIDEVRKAVAAGFVSVTLGTSRLRTETAGLASIMMMQLSKA